MRQQESSETAQIFGGPAALGDPLYRAYVQHTIKLLKSEIGAKFTILSYLPLNEPKSSFTWLELCKKLSLFFPERFAFAAFPIPEGQLRPFSFHVYGKDTVHIGLRSYSAHRDTATLTSSIMLRNAKIASRFSTDFLENFRRIGRLDDTKYSNLVTSFSGLDQAARALAIKTVDEIVA